MQPQTDAEHIDDLDAEQLREKVKLQADVIAYLVDQLETDAEHIDDLDIDIGQGGSQ
jgi:hypothetical protein